MNAEDINGSSSEEIPEEYLENLRTHSVPHGRKAWKNREAARFKKARMARNRVVRQIVMNTIMEGGHMYPSKDNYEGGEREEDPFMKAFRERCIQNQKKKKPKAMKPNRDPLPENPRADVLMKHLKDFCATQRTGSSKQAPPRGRRVVKRPTQPRTVPETAAVAGPSTSNAAKPTMEELKKKRADLKKKRAAKLKKKRAAEAKIVMKPQPKPERIANEFLKTMLKGKTSNQAENLLARLLENERKEREVMLPEPELVEEIQASIETEPVQQVLEIVSEIHGIDEPELLEQIQTSPEKEPAKDAIEILAVINEINEKDDGVADEYAEVNPVALADYLNSINEQIDGEPSLEEYLAKVELEDSTEEEPESEPESENEEIDVSKWNPKLQKLLSKYVTCRPELAIADYEYDSDSDKDVYSRINPLLRSMMDRYRKVNPKLQKLFYNYGVCRPETAVDSDSDSDEDMYSRINPSLRSMLDKWRKPQ